MTEPIQPKLTPKHLSIVYGPDSSVRAWINRWSKYDNPWNRWLGEQLMYVQSKGMDISFGEVFELIELANFGARYHGAFVYFLKEEQL